MTYPTEEQLDKIKNWELSPMTQESLAKFFDYIESIECVQHYGRLWKTKKYYRFATGGWSGNEEILSAMRKNSVFWMRCWYMILRGGAYWFTYTNLPKEKEEKEMI